jgi:hypothetical protein
MPRTRLKARPGHLFEQLTFPINGFEQSKALGWFDEKRLRGEIAVLKDLPFHEVVYIPPEKSREFGAIPGS